MDNDVIVGHNKNMKQCKPCKLHTELKDDCKACKRKLSLFKYNNKPERKAHLKEYFSSENGKERHSRASSKYNKSDHGRPIAIAASKKYYYSENGQKVIKEYNQRPEVKEKSRINSSRFQKSPEGTAYINSYNKEKWDTDIQFKLKKILRNRLCAAIKGNFKSGSAVADLGCTIEELKLRLESMWLEGMSWDNYTHTGWHIDHIKPLSSFDLSDPNQLKEACHYTNLQPLWALDNLKKSDS